MEQCSLFGEPIEIKKSDKKILKKIKELKPAEVNVDKILKSKTIDIKDKLVLIREEVYKVLGRYKDQVKCIRNLDEFKSYIDKSINNKIIAIDTETNNSLNSFDCKIMGLCLYTPGEKAAYIPVNHVDESGQLLKNQITEIEIKEQLERLSNTKKIYHNAVFDIEVIKTTCGVQLDAFWDTLIGAQLINENELKGLKYQYRTHIDKTQEKYDIEHLFKGLPYAIVDPELFALYAGTDSLITYKLYLWQKEILEKEPDVLKIMTDIEVPLITTIVNMEMAGVNVDLEYAKRMSIEYHKKSDAIQVEIDKVLEKLEPKISLWRLSEAANEKIDGKKSKSEQLKSPPELGSSTQLSILLYDILGVPVVDKKKPRTTDSAALTELAKSIPLCELMLKKREVDILINTFIDAIPTLVQKDGKVHPRFNAAGTVTGRFACQNPNIQQIPSHDKSIRLIFKGSEEQHKVEEENNVYVIPKTDEILMSDDSWKFAENICVGDVFKDDDRKVVLIDKDEVNYYFKMV